MQMKDAEETKKHFSETHFPFPVLQDKKSKWADQFGALKTPHAFVFNKSGELIYKGGVTWTVMSDPLPKNSS